MLANKAQSWVEDYLYKARGHRALEQSVFAAGERRGFSERRLRKAGSALGVSMSTGCWELHPLHSAALVERDLGTLTPMPVPALTAVASIRRAA
jgi:hypothetical protein